MDIDKGWPTVLKRQEALGLLQDLVPEELAEQVWKALLAPMYDRLRITQQWPRGKCVHCGAVHPLALRPSQPRRELFHTMKCPKYTGPLEHRPAQRMSMMLGHINVLCTCGQRYAERNDDDVKQNCPNRALDWRGARRVQ
jgi:hypothetical protein